MPALHLLVVDWPLHCGGLVEMLVIVQHFGLEKAAVYEVKSCANMLNASFNFVDVITDVFFYQCRCNGLSEVW